MVYCGKPSKSCAECRLRRTKCDMLRPSCSQCVRANRICKGYRDPGDLMFRDESKGLIAKAQRQKASQRPATTTIHVAERAANRSVARRVSIGGRSVPPVPIPISLNTATEDQATSFFFQNYVPDKGVFPTGGFQYLETIFNRENVGQAVADGIASLGMAGLSNFWKAPNIMVKASMKYTSALRLLSSQLRNVVEAKSDQTLAAVMLLGLYETNTCHSPKSMEAWTRHIDGASSIMKLRGKKELRTETGRGLFIHHRSQVIANCMQRAVAVPDIISEWNSALIEDPVQAAATSLSELYIKYTNIRGEMGPVDDFSNPEDTISRACALDMECAEWAQNCPVQYIYRTVRVNGPRDEVLSDHYHTYSNMWIAMIWNNYRSLRIRIHDLVLVHLRHFCQTHGPSELLFNDPGLFGRQKLESEEIILQSASDICASVPFILKFNPDPDAPHQAPRAFNGNLLLWPLYNAGSTESVPMHMRKWVISRLRYISEVMAIRQATPLVYSLSQKADLAAWDGEQLSKTEKDSMLVAIEIDQEVLRQKDVERGIAAHRSTIHQNLVLRSQDEYQNAAYQDASSHIVSYSQSMEQQSIYPDPSPVSSYHVSVYQNSPYQMPISLGERRVCDNMALGIPNFDEGW